MHPSARTHTIQILFCFRPPTSRCPLFVLSPWLPWLPTALLGPSLASSAALLCSLTHAFEHTHTHTHTYTHTAYTNAARGERFTVRPFTFDLSGLEARAQSEAKNEVEYNKADAGIYRFCQTGYGECFKAYMHTKCLRAYTESILRYGPPAIAADDSVTHNFCPMLVKPTRGRDAKVRDFFNKRYKDLFQDEADMRSDEVDAYPYVILDV